MTYEMHLFPGETEADALLRRVKMHEFLMTGGTLLGYDSALGRVEYSAPITLEQAENPDNESCPWHETTECIAWNEIRAGRGHWTRMERELRHLELSLIEDGDGDADLSVVEHLQEAMSYRPMGLDERRAIVHDGSAAFPKPWENRDPRFNGWFQSDATPRRPRLEDARDTAVRNLAFEPVPEEIEIEGDEEDD